MYRMIVQGYDTETNFNFFLQRREINIIHIDKQLPTIVKETQSTGRNTRIKLVEDEPKTNQHTQQWLEIRPRWTLGVVGGMEEEKQALVLDEVELEDVRTKLEWNWDTVCCVTIFEL